MKLNRTHQFLVNADDVNILGGSVHSIKENAESVVVASKEIVSGGADKSLARLISRYRRTETIVSLERGVCSCTELQVFSSYRG